MAVFIPKGRSQYYMSFRINGKQIFRSTRTRDKAEAERVERETVAEMEANPSDLVRLSDAIRLLYQEKWQHNKDGTQALTRANVCCKVLEDPPLEEVTQRDVETVKAALLAKGLAPRTVNGHLASLRTVLRAAARDWEVITRAPKVSLLKTSQGRTRVITPEEETRLLDYLEGIGDPLHCMVRDITIVLLETGMRLGEVLNLTWAHVNLQENTLLVRADQAKSGKARLVPMSTRCKEVIASCRNTGDVLFPVRKEYVSRIYKRFRDAAGLDDGFVPHACRHTAASRLLNSGATLFHVQRLLGHASIGVTVGIYGHLDLSELRRLLN
jgi:integrase